MMCCHKINWNIVCHFLCQRWCVVRDDVLSEMMCCQLSEMMCCQTSMCCQTWCVVSPLMCSQIWCTLSRHDALSDMRRKGYVVRHDVLSGHDVLSWDIVVIQMMFISRYVLSDMMCCHEMMCCKNYDVCCTEMHVLSVPIHDMCCGEMMCCQRWKSCQRFTRKRVDVLSTPIWCVVKICVVTWTLMCLMSDMMCCQTWCAVPEMILEMIYSRWCEPIDYRSSAILLWKT